MSTEGVVALVALVYPFLGEQNCGTWTVRNGNGNNKNVLGTKIYYSDTSLSV